MRVAHVVRLQRRLIGRDAGIHAFVVLGIVQHQRGLDLRHVGGRDLPSVIGDAGVELAARDREPVDHQPAEAEADRADLPGRLAVLFEERHARDQRGDRVVLVHLRMQRARLVLARRRPADQRQQVDRIGEKAFEREAPCHVFQVRVEAAVLVNDQHDRALALLLRTRQVAVDPALGGVVGEALGRKPRVIVRHDRGLRIVVLQQRQQRRAGRGRAGELGQAVEELPAADAAMGEAVVERDDALVHDVSPCVSARSRMMALARSCRASIQNFVIRFGEWPCGRNA